VTTTRADLTGRWVPAGGSARGRAFAELAGDGGWTGSDGCNRLRGTWSVGPGGAFSGTCGPTTRMACENVPIGRWIERAATAVVAGGELLLRDGTGTELARLVRASGPGGVDRGRGGGRRREEP
jgi:heat shock protein HslJ